MSYFYDKDNEDPIENYEEPTEEPVEDELDGEDEEETSGDDENSGNDLDFDQDNGNDDSSDQQNNRNNDRQNNNKNKNKDGQQGGKEGNTGKNPSNNGNTPGGNQAQNPIGQQGGQMGQQAGQQAGKEATKKASEEAAKKAAEKGAQQAATKAAASGAAGSAGGASLLAALGPILFWVLVVIVAIIILVGIIMFFMTVPGMVMEKLKAIFGGIGTSLANYFLGIDTTTQFDEQQVYDIMDYLEQMGYDLKGYGFITGDVDENTDKYDAKQGVARTSEGKIKEAESEIIVQYIISDNYAYTVKNFNQASEFKGFWGFLEKLGKNIINNLDIFNFVDNTKWGKGLISLKFENNKDYEKNIIDQLFGTDTSWDNIKVDAESKTMEIRRGWGANYYSYNLEGWTGRYSMPLEFLLSVHIATMKPDLTYEMARSFNTNVDIRLRDISDGTIMASYKGTKEDMPYIAYTDVEALIHGSKSDNIFSSILNWFDDLVTSDYEVAALFSLGIDHKCSGDDKCDFEGTDKEVTIPAEYDKDGKLIKEEETITVQKVKHLSDACIEHAKKIIDELSNTTDYHFETYLPYIKNVTGHWFRDVYFQLSASEASSIELTRTDLDYEKITNERWTLYEMYDKDAEAGNYKLYKYDEKAEYGIGELFFEDIDGDKIRGTQADVDAYNKKMEEEHKEDYEKYQIKVLKKQIDTYASDLADEDIITTKSDGSWSAYDIEDIDTREYKRVYPDEKEDQLKMNLYYQETLNSAVVQKEDGVRTVTNGTIKDIFLNRYYFSYDGTTETANIIAELREKVGMTGENKYGAVDEDKLDETYTVKYEEAVEKRAENGRKTVEVVNKEKEVNVRDYVSQVSLTQDSLAAFSMLENTHTLDADYIYKDFKELIVELGYFTKEELSDGRQKLLEFMVPEIGSYGYPISSLDKKENEYGTEAHSKEDYEANIKNTLAAAIAAATASEKEEKEMEMKGTADGEIKTEGLDISTPEAQNLDNIIGEIVAESKSTDDFITLGGISSRKSLLSLDEWWTEMQKMFDIFKSESWTYALDHSCSTFEKARSSKHTTDCSLMASWALQMVGALEEGQTFSSALGEGGSLDQSNACAESLIDAGAEVIIPTKEGISNYASAARNGKLEPGDILFYNGHVSIYCGESHDSASATHCWDTGSTTGIQCGGPRDTSYEDRPIKLIVRLPLGNSSGSGGGSYEGFEGGEAVVSPVTGILLEYGTYEEVEEPVEGEEPPVTDPEPEPVPGSNDEKDESEEEYRKNSDKKDKVDAVGYAKILVLNEEVADQLVTCTDQDHVKLSKETSDEDEKIKEGFVSVRFQNEPPYAEDKISYSVLSSDKASEDLEKLNDLQKALYGYSLFAKEYEDAQIGGYVLYIDGFKAELPAVSSASEGEEASGEEKKEEEPKEGGEKKLGSGQELTMDYFLENAASGTTTSTFTKSKYLETKYEADPVYNLMSEAIENQEKAKSEAKGLVEPLYKFEGSLDGNVQEMLLIKEGTVIGRTLSNQELVEDLRKETYGETEEEKAAKEKEEAKVVANGVVVGEENTDEVEGNYLRIIMRDTDDTVVENVEEYMKLDEKGGGKKFTGDYSEEFLYFVGVMLEGLSLEDCKNGYATAVDIGDGTVTAGPGVTNHLNSYFWELGYEQYVHNKKGSNIGMEVGDKIPIDVLIDVMLAFIDNRVEQMQKDFPNNSFTEQQVAAVLSVYYNFGSVPDRLKNAINSNSSDLQQVWEHLSDSQAAEYPGLPKRRKVEYILFSENKYVNKDNPDQELNFTTSTPFSDYLDGNNTVEFK